MTKNEKEILINVAENAWQLCGEIQNTVKDTAKDNNITITESDIADIMIKLHERIYT